MAPGVSPLNPISIPQASDIVTAALPPVSDAGFLALLRSGPATGLPQGPIPAGNLGISESRAQEGDGGETSAPSVAAVLNSASDNNRATSDVVPEIAGRIPVAPPPPAFWRDPLTLSDIASPDVPEYTAPPALIGPEITPVPATSPAEVSTPLDEASRGRPVQPADPGIKTPPLTPIASAQPSADRPATPTDLIPVQKDQSNGPVVAAPLAPVAATPKDVQPPDTRAQPAPVSSDPPGLSPAALRSEPPVSGFARPAAPQQATAPDPFAIAPPGSDRRAMPAPSPAAGAGALQMAPEGNRQAVSVSMFNSQGRAAAPAADIKAPGPAAIGAEAGLPQDARPKKSPVETGESRLAPDTARQSAPLRPAAAANPVPPTAPPEFLPSVLPARMGLNSGPMPVPVSVEQRSAPAAPPASPLSPLAVESDRRSAAGRVSPAPPKQALPAANIVQPSAGPASASVALPRPEPASVQPVSAPPSPSPGPALVAGLPSGYSGPARAAPPQPPQLPDAMRTLAGPVPQSIGPLPDRGNLDVNRMGSWDSEAQLFRGIDAPLLSGAPFRESLAPPAASSPAAALARAEQIASQINASLNAATNIANRAAPIEIALDPPELGQLRISVSRGDDGIVLNVAVDRPETLDLMRRHAGLLSQEFQRHGLENTGFTFSGRDGGQPIPGRDTPDDPAQALPEIVTDPPASAVTPATDGNSLDIRI